VSNVEDLPTFRQILQLLSSGLLNLGGEFSKYYIISRNMHYVEVKT
jgi:hypothetical protein